VLPAAGWFVWPVAKATLRPTVAIRLGVLRQSEQGTPLVLKQDNSLLPGDRMAVSVKPKRPIPGQPMTVQLSSAVHETRMGQVCAA
jgi:hypothetical protein